MKNRRTVHVISDKKGPAPFVREVLKFRDMLDPFADVTESELVMPLTKQDVLIARSDLVIVVLDQFGTDGGRRGILPLFPMVLTRLRKRGRVTLGTMLVSDRVGGIPARLRAPDTRRGYHLLGFPSLSEVTLKAKELLSATA